MTTPRPGIALYLTEIKVTDWAGLVRWYVETLGLKLALEDAAHQYALLDAGSGRLALKGGGLAAAPRDAVRLVFEVTNLASERDRLVGCGVIAGMPEESPEGYHAIRFLDPEGTPITLFCWNAPNAS